MNGSKIKKVGILTRREIGRPQILEQIIDCLISSKKEVFLSSHARENLLHDKPELPDMKEMALDEKLDLIIVLGGDGSILKAVRRLVHFDTFIIGINTGTLGFLSEIPPDNLENTCLTIWDSQYSIDERMLLKIEVIKKNGKKVEFRALNEIVVSQSAVARLINLPEKVNDSPLTTFRADGLIVATPTGSTAYNLAAGGPILHPRVESIILTPISPFSFSQKPLVIPSEKVVSLEITECNKEEIVITVDGQINEPLECGDIVNVTKHPNKVKFLRLPGESYFKTLREKLKWGEGL